MQKLAIFDVDYTLTKKETLMELFKFLLKKDPSKFIYLPRAIFSGLMYVIGVYDEKKVKETFLKFIDGIHERDMEMLVKEFYEKRLSKILYNDAIEMMKNLKNQGYKIYLISASPEFYLKELYNLKIVDKIIGTRFLCENGYHSRRMEGENCKGEEKVKRLKEELRKENIEVDYKNSYMFSDSLSDKPLMDIVGNAYLINYKKKHDTIQILKWK
uniref:HAD-IB family hydrolase n=1 Tax=Clostridium polynesiense TaxID=1325933 RepID=UPI0005903DA9|nr:HAD-IB family hydrolase [Clostridium polynesiense]